MLRAVLFDYGGVLTPAVPQVYEVAAQRLGVTLSALLAALGSVAEEIPAYEAGRLEESAFETLLAARLTAAAERTVAPDDLLAQIGRCFEMDMAMRDLVVAVRRSGVPTVLVANSWSRQTYPPDDDLVTLFDHVFLSREVGARKPDQEMFAVVAARLNLPNLEGCVFIDDSADNVAAAEVAGAQAILHTNAATTTALLSAVLPVADAGSGRG